MRVFLLEHDLDLNDLGRHTCTVLGIVDENEHGVQVEIKKALLYLPGLPTLDVRQLLSRSCMIDIEERLAEKYTSAKLLGELTPEDWQRDAL